MNSQHHQPRHNKQAFHINIYLLTKSYLLGYTCDIVTLQPITTALNYPEILTLTHSRSLATPETPFLFGVSDFRFSTRHCLYNLPPIMSFLVPKELHTALVESSYEDVEAYLSQGAVSVNMNHAGMLVQHDSVVKGKVGPECDKCTAVTSSDPQAFSPHCTLQFATASTLTGMKMPSKSCRC